MHFVTSRIPGNKTQVNTPFGYRIAESERDLLRIELEVIEEMTRRLGRQPTKAEMVSGPKPADDRTLEQKMERDSWRPKQTDTPDAMDALADQLETKTEKPNLSMSRMERMAADARRIAERNRGNDQADAKQAEKLNRLKHDIQKIDDVIQAENWRTERGSQRIVDLMTMLREQLVNGNDASETRRLRGEATRLLAERAKQESAANRAAIQALETQIKSIRDGSQLGNVGEEDPVRFRAEQLMAEGADSTSAWTQARAEKDETVS
jgi:hypothetical protein